MELPVVQKGYSLTENKNRFSFKVPVHPLGIFVAFYRLGCDHANVTTHIPSFLVEDIGQPDRIIDSQVASILRGDVEI